MRLEWDAIDVVTTTSSADCEGEHVQAVRHFIVRRQFQVCWTASCVFRAIT